MTNTTAKTHEQNAKTKFNPSALLSAWCSEVQCFSELEARISALPTEQLRGRVFERFAEAHLSVSPNTAAQRLWPTEQVVESIRARFNGALDRDRGIDGVFNTKTGDIHAYQVKFRTKRPTLSWTELSTFVGLTEEFDGRLIFTNCEDVAPTVTRRRGLYSVTGRDLDRLTAKDFERIQGWLGGQKPSFTPVPPLPHQSAALKDICTELEARDRATAVLACGTGKTLIGCWTAQRLQARRVLVLLPSLALVRQTLHEWVGNLPPDSFVWQCVCSDHTVDAGADSWVVQPEDLDFPVTTDPNEVRRFLDCEFSGTRIVFATYHSAEVVGCGMDRDQPFDLAVFDEAHRTAGRQGLKLSFALTDGNLPSRKRLFMTATPRHYDIRKRTRGGDLAAVYSMDDPGVYGRVVHSLGVARAAEARIICPYKVVISVVTDAEVKAEQLRCSEVVLDGEAANALDVANRLALARAVQRHGVRKVFSFHRSIAAARAFASDKAHGMGRFLKSFHASHINGAMPASKRDRLLKEFSDAPRALMSNARCLTEGVNVPAVDMVAFLTPKRSRVDIVQAIGRALRKPEGKQCGYVFVPVLLQPGESVETAVRRTDFEHVWEVLQALREQDTVLADCIQLMSEEVGRGRAMSEDAFAERVEVLGPEIDLESLRRAITVTCVRQLGSTWDERHGQLKAFHEQHGHCLVPQRRDEDSALAAWVGAQRINRRKGSLLAKRERKLSELGFEWDPIAAAWDARFGELKAFKTEHGHCDVPHRWPENPVLGSWVAAQRRFHRQGRLEADRAKRLESLGFVWDPAEAGWPNRLEELRAFAKENGHCDVSQKSVSHLCLGRWINAQRMLKRAGKLAADKVRKLEALGLRWNPGNDEWEGLYSTLAAFHGRHGHCQVPASYDEHPRLRAWTLTLRQQKTKGQLTPERLEKLDQLGFAWNAREARWGNHVSELKAFVQANGHAEIPQDHPANQALATWVVKQRQMKRKGRLTPGRIQELESLGFEWQPHESTWDERYSELEQLKVQGRPWNPPRGAKLAKWLKHQRHALKTGSLPVDRARRLRKLLENDGD